MPFFFGFISVATVIVLFRVLPFFCIFLVKCIGFHRRSLRVMALVLQFLQPIAFLVQFTVTALFFTTDCICFRALTRPLHVTWLSFSDKYFPFLSIVCFNAFWMCFCFCAPGKKCFKLLVGMSILTQSAKVKVSHLHILVFLFITHWVCKGLPPP